MSERQLYFSHKSKQDLDDIWDYLADFSEDAADKQIDRIAEKCRFLRAMPNIGLERDDLVEGLRRVLEGSYVIFYRVFDERIEIVRILQNRQDFKRQF